MFERLTERAQLSDAELDELLDRLVAREKRLPYEQGELQGKIQVLRARRDHGRRRQGRSGSSPG